MATFYNIKPVFFNPFATRHMWQMAILIWRIALFLNTSKKQFLEQKFFFPILNHNFLIYTDQSSPRMYFMSSKLCLSNEILSLCQICGKISIFNRHICGERKKILNTAALNNTVCSNGYPPCDNKFLEAKKMICSCM